MNSRAILLGILLMTLAGCSASHDDRSALATSPATVAAPQSGASVSARVSHRAVVTPQSGASVSAAVSHGAVVTPQSGASKAARAAAVESRKVTIPKIRDVPVSGVTTAPSASPTAVESRKLTIPKVRDVPASGVTIAGDELPPGVPYASDTDPVRIVSWVLSSTVIHPGDDITGDVVTSSNVASVTATVGSFSVAVPKVAQGKFHLQMKLPSMPLPPGDAKLIITAIRTDGKRTTREVPITVAL